MALDRVVAWATRWRESAGNPFDRSVLRAYNDDEVEDSTLFICSSILRLEQMVTPRIHSDSTLIDSTLCSSRLIRHGFIKIGRIALYFKML